MHPKVYESTQLQQQQRQYIHDMEEVPWERRQYMDEKRLYLGTASKGYAEKGIRVYSKFDFAKSKQQATLLCLIQYNPTKNSVNVLYNIRTKGGTTDTNIMDFFQNTVFPYLKPNDMLIMDNLGGGSNKKNPCKQHYNPKIRERYAKAHAEVKFLPPYSPMLNPIELFFGWLQRQLDQKGPFTNWLELEFTVDQLIEEFQQTPSIVDGFYRHRADGRELKQFWDSAEKVVIDAHKGG
jgi:transposase